MTRTRDPEERFHESYLRGEGCWLWMKALNGDGYGHFYTGSKIDKAHRASWRFHRGDIPSGMSVLHSCDNPRCVNPDHLFLGSQRDNVIDMAQKKRHWCNRDRCIKGHPFSGENLYIVRKTGKRQCLACKREARDRSRRRAEATA